MRTGNERLKAELWERRSIEEQRSKSGSIRFLLIGLATWKYLLVGGTVIALSLLGSFCLGYASLHGGGGDHLCRPDGLARIFRRPA